MTLIAAALFLFLQTESHAQWFSFNRSERLYHRCISLYESGRYPEARESIRQFLTEYPESHWSESLHFLDAKLETNAPEAVNKFRWFLQNYPSSANANEAAFLLGELYELAGDYMNAQECYLHVYQAFSRFSDEAGLRAAKCISLQQDIPAAVRLLDEYLSSRHDGPWTVRAREMRADLLYQSGDYPMAQEQYRRLISDLPSSEASAPQWYLRVAQIYEINGDSKAALQCYLQFEKAFPDSSLGENVRLKIADLARQLNISVSEDKDYTLHAGSFTAESDADSLIERLKKLGYHANIVLKQEDSQNTYLVRVGPYKTKELAEAVAEKLNKEAGVNAVVLSPDSSEGTPSGE